MFLIEEFTRKILHVKCKRGLRSEICIEVFGEKAVAGIWRGPALKWNRSPLIESCLRFFFTEFHFAIVSFAIFIESFKLNKTK